MKTIKKSSEIDAAKEKVWDVLTKDRYTRVWLAVFSPGSHALTDWQLNSKVVFADDSGSGIIGRIIVHAPYELLSIEYYGVLTNNIEDFESEEAKIFNGAHETYRLIQQEQKTLLEIESDMSEGGFESMSLAWDEALANIKQLAEKA